MSKNIFITGTATDVGKTYVTALIAKFLQENGINCAYYKAALSGADSIEDSDAGYVHKTAKLSQDKTTLISYLYKSAVSPHLAAKIERNPVCMSKILADYKKVCSEYSHVLVEGSGGVICPIRYDEEEKIMLEDIIKTLDLSVVIVADSGLGTINSTVLTTQYLKQKNINIKGIIYNNYTDTPMQKDNIKMIEKLTGVVTIAAVRANDKSLNINKQTLLDIFE